MSFSVKFILTGFGKSKFMISFLLTISYVDVISKLNFSINGSHMPMFTLKKFKDSLKTVWIVLCWECM